MYGYEKETTPFLSSIDNMHVYENAFAPASWTTPSHASMFTGKYPTDVGVHGRSMRISDEETCISKIKHNTGMFTASSLLTHGSGLEEQFDKTVELKGQTYRYNDAIKPQRFVREVRSEDDSQLDRIKKILSNVICKSPRKTFKNVVNSVQYKYATSSGMNFNPEDMESDKGAKDAIRTFKNWKEQNKPSFVL
jgi:hypothetical protein